MSRGIRGSDAGSCAFSQERLTLTPTANPHNRTTSTHRCQLPPRPSFVRVARIQTPLS